MRTLCPHCGTATNHRFGQLVSCPKCGKHLPVRLPRKVVYTLRTVAKPALVIGFIMMVTLILPAYKHYRENQKIQDWTNLSASSGNSLPATHTPH
ncbi:MAG: hypothetical protein DI628_01610 [Blastochloris viridis]|uniref:Uncharacterized protein n=1 Tax=Blastochloris viridis TaxID=1079 RepID=A0A6N4R7U4_BLAVI|nr:MAG: hypothetical protein DI628_01610 [Blastochloris viridis]